MAAFTSRRPSSILLDQQAHIGHPMNHDSIASAKSEAGHDLEVSLWIHPPPSLSRFCFRCNKAPCPDPNSEPEDEDFEDELHVVGAEGRFVLLRASFASSHSQVEYFMYKAGDGEAGEPALLDSVPLPNRYRLPTLKEFGIVPRSHGVHYLVAALSLGMDPSKYRLHLYSSEDRGWRTIPLLNPCPELNKVITSKVVTLGEGLLGWVDFQHGMLVCNLHEESPIAAYIPLPEPLPQNRDRLDKLPPGPSTKRFRDLICIDGVIKLVEMEHRVSITTEKPCDSLCDSDLIMSRKRKALDEKPKQLHSWDGWRVVMWSRTVSSTCWEEGPFVDVADISVDKSMHSLLLSALKGEADVEKRAFRDLYSAFPTLGLDGDDTLYLKSVVKFRDPDGGRMVAVDLGKKRVKALGAYSVATHAPSVKAFRPCTVLSITLEADVSTCGKVRQAVGSANDPNNTQIFVSHTNSCGSENKHPSLLAEGKNLGPQSIVQNDHISRPVENNLPSRPRFINYDRPCYPGPSLWYRRKNQPLQQCFNQWDGPCNPGYAPLAPTARFHGYSNYQPPWQQPSPLNQQLTPTSVFGFHEAAQPCFKKWEEDSFHRHSGQLPSLSSFDYGMHSDSRNSRVQPPEPVPIHKLPIFDPWEQPPPVLHQLIT